MGALKRLLVGAKRDLTEKDWMRGTPLWSRETNSGRIVTPATALELVTVFACVRVLAETLATLPLVVYRYGVPRGRIRDTAHPLYRPLHSRPNPELTSVELRECMMGHLALRGNAFAQIVPLGSGSVELWPLRPDRMRVVRLENRQIGYLYTLPSGEERALPRREVLHVRGISPDGLVGYSPITLAREAVGLGLALEEHGARIFGNGAEPGGVLQTDQSLTDEAYERLKASWEAAHKGLENSHRVAILEEGIKWQQVGLSGRDAQWLEQRKYQRSEIAALYRVPPHMIQDLERTTFSNIEHQSIDFVVHTVRPWAVRWEQAIERDILTEPTHFVRFTVDGLLRGDIQSRYAAYSVGRQNGWLSANDVRDLEDLNPLPAAVGDIYWAPLNMVPADQLGGERSAGGGEGATAFRAETRAAGSAASRLRLARTHRRLFVGAVERLVRRESAEVTAAAERHLNRRDAASFLTWLREYYQGFGALATRTLLPVLLAFADVVLDDAAAEIGSDDAMADALADFIAGIARTFGEHYAGQSLGQLAQQVRLAEERGEDPLDAVTARLGEWGETRADKTADIEQQRLLNAVTRERWRRGGVRLIVWVRQGGTSCPFCVRLDGKVVGIDQEFARDGDEIEGDEESGPLRVDRPTRHPPIHATCKCGLRPERG